MESKRREHARGGLRDTGVVRRVPGLNPSNDSIPEEERTLTFSDRSSGSNEFVRTPSTRSSADIQPIPGYELLGVLGTGATGTVFRARDLSLKRQVAIKIIHGAKTADDVAALYREAQAIARLSHPNIVQVFGAGDQDGLPYMAMEFVNAGSLANFLRGSPQPPKVAARFVMEVAHAIQYAHDRGLVHRDIKPSNILLHVHEEQAAVRGANGRSLPTDLSKFVPKITDFGLAKHRGSSESEFARRMIGTPSYMAPEQTGASAQKVGPPADVYALGALLFEMLTGRPPFIGDSIEEIRQHTLRTKPKPPGAFSSTVPRMLDEICLACLQKNADKRYPTARSLAEDLRRFLDDEPIVAAPTSSFDRIKLWAKRRPLSVLNYTVIFIVLVASMVAWGRMFRDLTVERDDVAAKSRDATSQVDWSFRFFETAVDTAQSNPDPATRSAAVRKARVAAVRYHQAWLQEFGEHVKFRERAGVVRHALDRHMAALAADDRKHDAPAPDSQLPK